MRIKVILIAMALMAACNSRSLPGDIISQEKMQPLVFDLIRADELVNNFTLRDTLLKNKEEHIKMYEQVFKIHHTTREAFYKSFKYYQEHPDVNKVLLDSLLSYTTEKRKALYEKKVDTLAK